MKNPVWTQALNSCADPRRAGHYLDLLATTTAAPALESISQDQARILAALFSGSQALGNLLAANPDWLAALEPEPLKHPRREQGFRREVEDWLKPLLAAGEYETALERIRRFKQREMLRIAARDLARLGRTSDITREISDVADVCLSSVLELCRRQFAERYGQPWHQDADARWHPTAFCVLGLGKLGGR
jgi:glutamate-ammonia-ligase adenylyltransferase